ncbi:MAG: hypothetical protein AAF713_05720 [Pseudomonadota bacterium]
MCDALTAEGEIAWQILRFVSATFQVVSPQHHASDAVNGADLIAPVEVSGLDPSEPFRNGPR